MSTTFTYTEDDFEPFTKILSAAANSKFDDIKTRLNFDGSTASTGLGDDNIQSNTVSGGGLTRSTKLKAGTANYVVINDGTGLMSEEATLAVTRGGLGQAFTLPTNAGKGIVVNDAETAFTLGTPSVDRLTEQFAADVASLTVGEAIASNDAVCVDIHNGTGSDVYRIFKCDSDLPNRRYNFLGFATAAAAVTAGTYTWTDSAALVTGNSVAFSINGRSYTQAFNTDNDTTLAAIATKIAADADVQSASVVDAGSNDRVINITARGALSLNIAGAVVTGGASQATIVIANVVAPVGAAVRVRCFGPMSGFTSLAVGQNYYLSGTAGLITVSPTDSNPIFVGQALSSTVLFVNRNVGSFQFGTPSIFIRAFGGSAGEGIGSNLKSDSEHFNFTSWATGVSDSAAKFSLQSGDNSLGGYLVSVDGQDSTATNLASLRKYNKTSWSTGTNRVTARASGGGAPLASSLYVGNGSLNGDTASSTAAVDAYNGASWTAGVGTLANGTVQVSCFTQGGKAHWIGGVTAVGGTPDRHDTFDGVSASTATAPGLTSYMGGGATAASSSGISGSPTGSTSSKLWNGASWSSSTTVSYSSINVSAASSAVGPASGFNVGSAVSYMNGGCSSSSVSVTSTSRFNGASWSADTASATARCGATGGVV